MEQYTTTCGTVLPEVEIIDNYPLVFYKVSEEWEEFLRCKTPYDKFEVDADFLKKIAKACATMYFNGGIGIAANQVGFKENWCVIDTGWTKNFLDGGGKECYPPKRPRVILNPNIDESLLIETEKTSHEGCLSVPLGFKGDVQRHTAVHLVYTNLKGEQETWDAVDLDACAVMHELDHLRGKLFIDHISRLRLGMLEKKLVKVQKRVKNQIRNHNKSIIAQVKKLNQMAAFGYRPKEESEDEPLVVEAPETLELTDEQVSDITG